MADPTDTTPRLHTAPNDATVYAPLSWLAMAALAVAILFAVLLVVLGLAALAENKPFNETWLLLLPAFGLVLAFAGRRHVRNSEGTRQGERYATAAWWVCAVGAVVYGVNLLGIGFSIRSDADRTFTGWAKNLAAADTTNPNDPPTAEAFYLVTEAGQRGNFSPTDAPKMRAIYGPKFAVFRQTKLLMVLARNKGACEFAHGGLQSWEQTAGQVECTFAATLKTPEGDFPLLVPMVAKAGAKGREWMIRTPDGYVVENAAKPVARTPYGWWMENLAAASVGAAAGEVANAAKVAGGGPMPPDNFFVTLPVDGAGGPKPPLADLKYCWEYARDGRLQTPGAFLGSGNAEKNPLLLLTDDGIESQVPLELRPRDAHEKGAGSRARLVFMLDDPEVLAQVRAARAEGAAGPRTTAPPDAIASRVPKWKAVRLESTLKVEKTADPQQPGPGG